MVKTIYKKTFLSYAPGIKDRKIKKNIITYSHYKQKTSTKPSTKFFLSCDPGNRRKQQCGKKIVNNNDNNSKNNNKNSNSIPERIWRNAREMAREGASVLYDLH